MHDGAMQILSTPEMLLDTFKCLLDRSTSVQIVTAWATCGPALECIVSSRGPSIQAIVGVSMGITDPKALDQLHERGILDIADSTNAIFHPKLYLFDHNNDRTVLIGSPNLTKAAFTANAEVAVAMSPSADEWQRFQALFTRLRLRATPFDAFDMDDYRRRHKEARLQELARRESSGRKEKKARPNPHGPTIGELLDVGWHQYLEYLRFRLEQEFPDSGRVLDDASQGYLYTLRVTRALAHRPFSSLSQDERGMLLGGTRECGWFGNLSVARNSYPGLVHATNNLAVAAIDWLAEKMPPAPAIDEALAAGQEFFQRLTALDGFKAPFATRLLTLSRPDVFCSVNGKSRSRLQRMFAINNIATWEGYAKCLARLHRSPWWNSPRPSNSIEGELWDARVALIDAYVYDPRTKDEVA